MFLSFKLHISAQEMGLLDQFKPVKLYLLSLS